MADVFESPTLEGLIVRLEPLKLSHLDSLCDAGLYPDLWTHNAWPVRDRAGMAAYIRKALEGQQGRPNDAIRNHTGPDR
jgi:hypothetical protein